MAGNKNYIVIFKDHAEQDTINTEIAQVEKDGGKITQRYESSFMKGFAASMPESMASNFQSLTEGGKHESIDYIEPDQTVQTMT